MNTADKITSINDNYLKETLDVVVLSTMDLLNKIDYKSITWDIHIAGLAYGIWISICDSEFITLEEIAKYINNAVLIRMN